MKLRLGVNIDHVATLRNARGGFHPCPVQAALAAMDAGADGITAHLREDRRHIKDADIERLKNEVPLPLNLEMAATDEMLAIALRVKPHAVCLVPEKRAELTTEGGLDVVALEEHLKPYVKKLQDNGSRVSLFIDPNKYQIEAAHRIGVRAVELHTGGYAEAFINSGNDQQTYKKYLAYLYFSAEHTQQCGLELHAGHGLNYENVPLIATLPNVAELNIGHFLIAEAVFTGIKEAIMKMRKIIDDARKET